MDCQLRLPAGRQLVLPSTSLTTLWMRGNADYRVFGAASAKLPMFYG